MLDQLKLSRKRTFHHFKSTGATEKSLHSYLSLFVIIIDIKYEDIDENLWKSGMAMNHGEDREGNPIGKLSLIRKEGGREEGREWTE